jgi:enolase
MNIKSIQGLQILDSRGNPTVKAYIELDNGIVGTGSVPSGASTGTHEALELRDGGKEYGGLAVTKAIEHINTKIAPALIGMPIDSLKKLDTMILMLDESEQKKELGANAVLAVSMALARALSNNNNEPLWKTLNNQYFSEKNPSFPRLMVNVINGGTHANWNIDFQEYMLIPKETKPSISIRQAAETFHVLKSILKDDKQIVAVGDEGGFAPQLNTNKEGFALLDKAIEKAGYSRDEIDLGADFAASEIYQNNTYNLKRDNKVLSSDELISYYKDIIATHNVFSFEDPFAEDDWESYSKFAQEVGSEKNIVGDDLFVTNTKRIQKGIDEKAANAVLIKMNQIGSVYETVQAIKLTQEAGWKVAISHRSGETEDSFIADLAFACGADFLKAGSMSRSDRLAKYNRLLEIEGREFSK